MNIFLNFEENRVRAGWRLAIQLLLGMIAIGLIAIADPPLMLKPGGNILVTGAGILLSIWFCVRFIDLKKLTDYGLRINKKWLKELFIGMVFGILAMVFIFLLEWSFGWVHIESFGWSRAGNLPYILQLSIYLVSMLFVGFYEELMFRGYQLTNLFEGFKGPRFSSGKAALAAVLISSAFFGLMHFENPNASWLSTVNIIGAGVMLALPFVVTGRLSMSIGIHFAWNFMQGGILGFAVSGIPFRFSLLQINQSGPIHWTGGFFGPEAGISGILGITLIVILQILYFLKTQKDLNIGLAANLASALVKSDVAATK